VHRLGRLRELVSDSDKREILKCGVRRACDANWTCRNNAESWKTKCNLHNRSAGELWNKRTTATLLWESEKLGTISVIKTKLQRLTLILNMFKKHEYKWDLRTTAASTGLCRRVTEHSNSTDSDSGYIRVLPFRISASIKIALTEVSRDFLQLPQANSRRVS
jgi:hypothetical protein